MIFYLYFLLFAFGVAATPAVTPDSQRLDVIIHMLKNIEKRLDALEDCSGGGSNRRNLGEYIREENEHVRRQLYEIEQTNQRRDLVMENIVELSVSNARRLLTLEEIIDNVQAGVTYISSVIDSVASDIGSVGDTLGNMAGNFTEDLYDNARAFEDSVLQVRDNVVSYYQNTTDRIENTVFAVTSKVTDEVDYLGKNVMNVMMTFLGGIAAALGGCLGVVVIVFLTHGLIRKYCCVIERTKKPGKKSSAKVNAEKEPLLTATKDEAAKKWCSSCRCIL